MVGATLGMADDDGGRACIHQHFGGDIAGIGAGGLGMAILGPHRDLLAACLLCKGCDQGCRRANQQICFASHLCRTIEHGVEFGSRALQAVHFPVAGDQGADGIGHVKFQQIRFVHALAEVPWQFQRPGAFNRRDRKPTGPEVAGGKPPLYDHRSIW